MDLTRKLVVTQLNANNRFSFGLDDVETEALRKSADELRPASAGDLVRYIITIFLREKKFLTDEMYDFFMSGGRFDSLEKTSKRRVKRGR